MKVRLIDVDSHNFPNLCLMKLSAYHKKQNDDVGLYSHLEDQRDTDVCYASKVFTFSKDVGYYPSCGVIKGGTGYDLENKLPDDIEKMTPDYSLYNDSKTAYGFCTRGCPNNCPFCVVTPKEGAISRQVSSVFDFYKSQQTIKLLDPNLLACKDAKYILKELSKTKAWIDFTQGLDIRCMTDEYADLVMRCKVKMIHFAWDMEKQEKRIIENLKKFKEQTKIDYRRAKVYVLTNFDTNFEYDLYRVYRLKDLGYDPYIMIYNKESCDRKYRRLQRWVNSKQSFRTCERFEDYTK